MRVASGIFACLAGWVSCAFAAPDGVAPQRTYHLHGYYKLYTQQAIWELSDDSPWQVVKGEPWINSELVHWSYVPMTHDSQHYYCLIDEKPRTGTNILEKTFICGDPLTVELDYNNHWNPHLSLYGGH